MTLSPHRERLWFTVRTNDISLLDLRIGRLSRNRREIFLICRHKENSVSMFSMLPASFYVRDGCRFWERSLEGMMSLDPLRSGAIGRAGFTATGPKEQKFLRRFLQKAGAFLDLN
jgi:hypothetical protein